MTQVKLIDAGIDYLRITSQRAGPQARMLSMFREIADKDYLLGYNLEKGGAFGFWGEKTRHALIGMKKDWYMLQISGYMAKRGLLLAQEGSQCSRIDLQLTFFVGEAEVEKTIREAYIAACMNDDALRRHLKVTMIEQRGKAQTVYLGSRASDIFCRIYDKHAESGKEEHVGCVRFELELKGRASKALWQKLCTNEVSLMQALQMAVSTFAQRGVEMPLQDIQEMDIQLPKAQPTTIEATTSWLARQVAPTVARISKEWGWSMPFLTLFSKACSEHDRTAIMNALSIAWGS